MTHDCLTFLAVEPRKQNAGPLQQSAESSTQELPANKARGHDPHRPGTENEKPTYR
jgi:hypothetical protein